MSNAFELDVGPLTWVKGEIDLALTRADETLAACGGAPEKLGAARRHLHQAHGALSIVGLDGVTLFTETIEQFLIAVEEGKCAWSAPAEWAARQSLNAVHHYLDDLVAGRPDQPLRLYEPYRDLALARGLPSPEPAELFFPDLTQRPPRREEEDAEQGAEAVAARLKVARLGFERGLLKWFKNDVKGVVEMRNSVAVIEQTQTTPGARAFWWAALAFLDAVAADALPADADARRLGPRIDAQIKKLVEGSATVSERLMREVLYYVAIAGAAGEHVEIVRAAYRLVDLIPGAGAAAAAEARRPLLRAAREHVVAAMEEWNRFGTGIAAALPGFHERIARCAEKLRQLDIPPLAGLGAAVLSLADHLRRDPLRQNEFIATAVATALLLIEDGIDGFAELGAEFETRAAAMSARLAAVERDAAPADDAPCLDEIARRAGARMLTTRVAREIHADLATVEQTLDAYFRDPARAAGLTDLAAPLHRIEEALAALGEECAAALLRETAARIAAFADPGRATSSIEFEEVANRLSALGVFVERRQTGRADLDVLLGQVPSRPPAAPRAPSVEAELQAMQRMTRTMVDALRETPESAALRGEVRQNLENLRDDARLVADSELEQRADAALAAIEAESPALAEAVAALAPSREAPAPPAPEVVELAAAGEDRIDAELLAIFLEEAREVLAAIAVACPRAHETPAAHDALIELRRAFHTLKGSGRMVGLADLGEAAWAIERTIALWLQQERPATPELLTMIDDAHALFRNWAARLAAEGGARCDAEPLIARCAGLRAAPLAAATSPPAPPVATAPPTLKLVHSAPPPEPPVRVGDIELSATLYRIYLDEARGHLATLQEELGCGGCPRPDLIRAAHTLASTSAAGGIESVQALAHTLEVALVRFAAVAATPDDDQRLLFARAIGALEGMVGAVAERRLPGNETDLGAELEALKPSVAAAPDVERRSQRIADELDLRLLPVFLSEAAEQLPQIENLLRAWRENPADGESAARFKRQLHTLKGNARMTGAMAIGELVHSMETRVAKAGESGADDAFFDVLETSCDRIELLLAGLAPQAPEEAPVAVSAAAENPPRAMLRVRAELLDRLVDEAGEIAIARSRIEGEMRALKDALGELTGNVLRLRGQLREIEIQAETRMTAHRGEYDNRLREFDPLEFDRFTRFQELTRMMAESVDDVSTVQHGLLRTVERTRTALTAQARLNRDLTQALMNARMVPFATLAERLHRVVRQTAKETGKRANLDIRGGDIDIDRSVLERMTAPLEHLLRNAVVHGVETPAAREVAGKPACGEIALAIAQEGNEFQIVLEDDGAGLDLARIRANALARGVIDEAEAADERRLIRCIFASGVSTATQISAVAGRGVGLDVVDDTTADLGGRIEVTTRAGHGTRFALWLPLTLAVTQAVLVRSGPGIYAIPANMVERADEMKPEAIAEIRATEGTTWRERFYSSYRLSALLGENAPPPQSASRPWLLLIKHGERCLALEVDAMEGNREIVVKNIGPQLARIAGFSGATVLGDGAVALILNPVALVARAGATTPAAAPAVSVASPEVLIVDDSLTVRKITGRLLERAGYRVVTAKDGLDALEKMADRIPAVVLTDIEMPRMDGFELVRAMKSDARLRSVPVVAITSRTADKHRDYALDLGVADYLGKPYDEERLLALVADFTNRATPG